MSFCKPEFSLSYIPAQLKKQPSHGWVIEYYALDNSGALRRMVIRMNALRKRFVHTNDFRAHCNGVVCGINAKLAGGWTPFGAEQNTRLYLPIVPILDEYLKDKANDVRPDTLINYRSFCKVFREWIEAVCPGAHCSAINKVLAVKFMNYIRDEKGLSGRSYNNRLKQARALFSWMVNNCYCTENPFATLKTKREEQKKRILIPAEYRARIADYFLTINPNYFILCELVFSAMIRPKEAWRLKVSDIDLMNGYIAVGADKSKTHFSRTAALTPQLRASIADMIQGARPDDYLFGRDYQPAQKQIVYSRFRKDWDTMRQKLNLPPEMQLYSLRDTGLNEMLKSGIDPLTVMQHADHHDLSMTTRYANHADPHLVETICAKAPRF